MAKVDNASTDSLNYGQKAIIVDCPRPPASADYLSASGRPESLWERLGEVPAVEWMFVVLVRLYRPKSHPAQRKGLQKRNKVLDKQNVIMRLYNSYILIVSIFHYSYIDPIYSWRSKMRYFGAAFSK